MERTIAAISTPAGVGGIAVVRMSGEKAVETAAKIYDGAAGLESCASHTVHYGYIKNSAGERIDEVLVTVMRAPRTFTGEDTVEISTHGGMVAPKRVLDACIEAGAAPAEPGEFTKKAFLNGKIDLAQAEAVIDIINSQNDLAQKNAFSQLEGRLSKEIGGVRHSLISLAARMQVAIDYPDEDLEDVTPEEIADALYECENKISALISSSDDGRIIRDGIGTAIVGKPNVGKSSLMNALTREDTAIVTPIAGTTRDTITEYVKIDGVPLRLIDTAGIRETEDTVEKMGVEKSRRAIDSADLVLAVFDASRPLDDEDEEVLREAEGKKGAALINKTDIGELSNDDFDKIASSLPVISISAKTGEGLDKLKEFIKSEYKIGSLLNGGFAVSNLRHKSALLKAREAVSRALGAISGGLPQDLAALDINAAIEALGEITGDSVSEDIVQEIFHSFCVGK